jgi:hypothetical protein
MGKFKKFGSGLDKKKIGKHFFPPPYVRWWFILCKAKQPK